MTLVAKTRLAKRKQEMQDVRKENHTATSKTHDKRCLGKPEEDTSMLQIKILQEQLNTVVEENRKNLHTIKELEGKISAMESEYQSKNRKSHKNPKLNGSSRSILVIIVCIWPAVMRN